MKVIGTLSDFCARADKRLLLVGVRVLLLMLSPSAKFLKRSVESFVALVHQAL